MRRYAPILLGSAAHLDLRFSLWLVGAPGGASPIPLFHRTCTTLLNYRLYLPQ
jgi:hypothetical protein